MDKTDDELKEILDKKKNSELTIIIKKLGLRNYSRLRKSGKINKIIKEGDRNKLDELLGNNEKFWAKRKINISGSDLLLIFSIIGLFFAYNQVVQPIRTPRISTVEKTSLFFQGDIDVEDKEVIAINDYQIYKITYYIEPPLFTPSWLEDKILFSKSLKIRLPEDSELYTPKSEFWDNTPYVTFKVAEDLPMFIAGEENQTIEVIINPSGREIKKLPFILYFRKKIQLGCTDPDFSGPHFWNRFDVDMEHIPIIDCSHEILRTTGRITRADGGIVHYRFKEVTFTNYGNLDILSFAAPISIPGNPPTFVCKNREDIRTIKTNEGYFILPFLKSGESRTYTLLYQMDDPTDYEIGAEDFNFTYSGCQGDWIYEYNLPKSYKG